MYKLFSYLRAAKPSWAVTFYVSGVKSSSAFSYLRSVVCITASTLLSSLSHSHLATYTHLVMHLSCHAAIWSHRWFVIQSLHIRSSCQTVILSRSHLVIQLSCQKVILSHSHFNTLLVCHGVNLPCNNLVTQSSCIHNSITTLSLILTCLVLLQSYLTNNQKEL